MTEIDKTGSVNASGAADHELQVMYHQIFENTEEAILFTEPSGTVFTANPAATRLFGYTVEEMRILGRSGMMDMNDPRLESAIEIRKKTGHYRGELNIICSDGTTKPCLFISDTFKDKNGDDRTCMLISDQSEQKEVERKMLEQYEQLSRMNAEKDKLLSILAHDLRNPFNSLLGFTGLLSTSVSDYSMEQIQQIADTMHRSAQRLYGLMENLLSWSMMQRGLFEYKPARTDLSGIVSDNINLYEQDASNKGIRLVNRVPEFQTVVADKPMIDMVIRNLISNAIKFSNSGGTVTIESSVTEAGEIEISVTDQGIGIPEPLRGNLFRLGETTSRRGTSGELSTGLGLILCQECIVRHGGTLRVESEEGNGSRFIINLPPAGQP